MAETSTTREDSSRPASEADAARSAGPRRPWRWVVAGAVAGGVVGAMAGVVYPHWGSLLAVGAFPWVVGIEIGVPVGGLIGALAFLSAEREWFEPPPEDARTSGHRLAPPAAVGVAAVAGLLVVGVGLVLTEEVFLPDTAAASARVHWNTKNTSRFGDSDPALTSVQVARAVFPGEPPDAVVVAEQDPVAITAAAPLLRTLNGPLLLASRDDALLPAAGRELVGQWQDAGLDRVVTVGHVALGRVLSATAEVEGLDEDDPAALFDQVNELLEQAGLQERPVVAVGGDAEHLLPAAAWLAHEPSPLAWAEGGDVLFASPTAVAHAGGRDRVGAVDVVTHALEVAQYRDEDMDVGWGIDDTEPESWHNALLANPTEWEQAAAGIPLAAWGKPGPLLWTGDDGELPRPVESFLWPLGPAFEESPKEGPYNHTWVLGSLDDVPYETQARVDYLSEIQPVQTRGPGVTWVELIVLIWMALAFLSSLWVLADALARLPVPPVVKAAWFTSTLLLGPIGAALYVAAYRHRRLRVRHGMATWERPMWLQAAVATSRSVAAGTFFMVLTSAFVLLAGSPLVPNDLPWLFVVGNNMVLTMIVVAYLVALVLATLVFMAPMMRHHMTMTTGRPATYWQGVLPGLRNMAINMTVLTAFMFAGMWIWMMELFQMGADQSQLFWWYALLAGVAAGVAAIYPVNWWLVHTGRKGGMT